MARDFTFSYLHDGPTIERALRQALVAASACWEDWQRAGQFEVEDFVAIESATSGELRRLITFRLSGLLDASGIAKEWNDAIETAIRAVEEMP
jgi:hypothetical protein